MPISGVLPVRLHLLRPFRVKFHWREEQFRFTLQAGGDVAGVAIAAIGKINGVSLSAITKVNGVA